MSETFWVLERDNCYITVRYEERPEGGKYQVLGWTKDIREARHWPARVHADRDRGGFYHPFWMAGPVEHAMLSADVYADGLAEEIGRLRPENAALNIKLAQYQTPAMVALMEAVDEVNRIERMIEHGPSAAVCEHDLYEATQDALDAGLALARERLANSDARSTK